MSVLLERMKEMMGVENLDEETTRMVERMVILRLSTKHINLWIRQLEMKRKEICELAGMMKLEKIKEDVQKEKSLERWARRCTTHFPKRVKRVLFGEIDNMIWNGHESEITQWCKRNKVFDEITENEIMEIWMSEEPDDEEAVRLNGKYVWETAKRVCEFINSHEDLITITSFAEYRNVMKKVMKVIKEAHNIERKRRMVSRKAKSDELKARTQRTKALIAEIKQRKMRKDEIERRVDQIFGKGSSQEIKTAMTKEKMVERIEEMAKREEQFDKWETMRKEAKRKQREDRRLNLFWRRNKTFPKQFGGDEETPNAKETLAFWRSINNKEVSDGWKYDESIQVVLQEMRDKLG